MDRLFIARCLTDRSQSPPVLVQVSQKNASSQKDRSTVTRSSILDRFPTSTPNAAPHPILKPKQNLLEPLRPLSPGQTILLNVRPTPRLSSSLPSRHVRAGILADIHLVSWDWMSLRLPCRGSVLRYLAWMEDSCHRQC